MKRSNISILIAVFLVITTVIARIVNANLHIPNIVPIAAISLFCGAIIKDNKGLAFLVPLLGQFLADVYFQFFTQIPGFYDLTGQLFNYGALIAATAMGTMIKNPKPVNVLPFIAGAPVIFFIVSNFGYFAQGWNGYTASGFVKTYADAIPFFKYTLIGDLAGGVLLFGGYFLAQSSLIKKAQQVNA